jgi:AraC family transcriptional regulator
LKKIKKEVYQMQPEIINRPTETVLYIQEKGDYAKTPEIALKKIVDLLNEKGIIKAIYGMGLDNPLVTDSEACRFDACAKMINENIEYTDSIHKKDLEGGLFAVFTHKGPYSQLSETCNRIFQEWFPTSPYKPSGLLFCEYVNFLDKSQEIKSTKIYVPIKA